MTATLEMAAREQEVLRVSARFSVQRLTWAMHVLVLHVLNLSTNSFEHYQLYTCQQPNHLACHPAITCTFRVTNTKQPWLATAYQRTETGLPLHFATTCKRYCDRWQYT